MAVDGDEVNKVEEQPEFLAQLQAILNVLPAYTWYAAPSGALIFVNRRTADYLGLPEDHPLRFGIDIGAQWDDWVPLLHPDDQEEARHAKLFKYFGRSLEELKNCGTNDTVHPEDLPRILELVKRGIMLPVFRAPSTSGCTGHNVRSSCAMMSLCGRA